MAYLRKKTNGHTNQVYYSIVEGRREGGKVKQVILEYIGNEQQLKQYIVDAYLFKQQMKKQCTGQKSEEQNHEEDTKEQDLKVEIKTYSHGAVMALYWTCELLGLRQIMRESFTLKTSHGFSREDILILAILHRAIDPGSKRSFSSWAETTSLPYYLKFSPEVFSSQTFWEAMDGISEDEIQSAWTMIVHNALSLFNLEIDRFHLDYTNYFTFIDTKNGRCLVCKRGHNKQKRDDLRQFSLAVLTAFTLKIPIVWDMYEGNKNDKEEFASFIKSIKDRLPLLGISTNDITVTFDGGSNSESNFSNIGFHIICAHTLTSHKDLYEIDIDQYSKIYLSNGTERLAFRISEKRNYSGIEGIGILTFSQALKDGQVSELCKDLEKAKDAVLDINERLINSNSRLYTALKKRKKEFDREQKEAQEYNDILEKDIRERELKGEKKRGAPKKKIQIKEWDEKSELADIIRKTVYEKRKYLSSFTNIELKNQDDHYIAHLSIDKTARDAYTRKYYGKKLTITDHVNWTTEQILEEYANQECIENDIFRVSKNTDHFSVRPQYHWTDDKILVHTFICMTAITVSEILRRYMEEAGIKITKMAMLEKLNHIRDGWMITPDHKVTRFLEQMSDEEQQLWNVALSVQDMVQQSS